MKTSSYYSASDFGDYGNFSSIGQDMIDELSERLIVPSSSNYSNYNFDTNNEYDRLE